MQKWHKIVSAQHCKPIIVNTWRIVESQAQSTTRKFVDSSIEHDVLEGIIHSSKPAIRSDGDEHHCKHLHYLLATAFRYPPLAWGSRFGTKLERSILYTSGTIETAMSETAFYKMSFLRASVGKIGGKTIPLTAFIVNIASKQFVDLCDAPYCDYEQIISSKTRYESSQALGAEMRKIGVACFQYSAARCPNRGVNFGVLSPIALLHNKNLPKSQKALLCYATKNVVEFRDNISPQPALRFTSDTYLVDGAFPFTPEFAPCH